MSILSIFFAGLVALAQANDVAVTAAIDVSPDINKTLMLQLINDVRKKGCNCGSNYYSPVVAITWNDKLEKAALGHSNDMYATSYFSHKGKNGNTAGLRIKEAGYSWSTYGENIAHGYNNEKAVIEGWLNSPGHCANIMTGFFKEVGVAKSGTYWTMNLATK